MEIIEKILNDNVVMYLNAVCNFVIAWSMVAFIIFVFGTRNGMMQKLPALERFSVKVGLVTICCGSVFNLFTLSTPPITELILNVGLAIIFLWGAVFHFKYFVPKKKN